MVLVALMGPMELVGGALAGVLLGGLCALLLPSRLPRAQRPSKLLQPHRMELPALSSEDAAVDDDGGAAAEGGEGVVAGLEDVELGEGPEREVPAHEHAAREHDALGEEKSDRAVGDEAGSQRSRDSQRGSHERDLAAEALEAEAEERRVARVRGAITAVLLPSLFNHHRRARCRCRCDRSALAWCCSWQWERS